MDELRLKLAVQKSGRLTDPSLDMLTRLRIELSRGKDQLMVLARTCRSMCCSSVTTIFLTWSRKMSATWASVGLNVLEESA